jgi:hypothetical protein
MKNPTWSPSSGEVTEFWNNFSLNIHLKQNYKIVRKEFGCTLHIVRKPLESRILVKVIWKILT